MCIVSYETILGVYSRTYVMLNAIGHPIHMVIGSELEYTVCTFTFAVSCAIFSLTYDDHTVLISYKCFWRYITWPTIGYK